MNTMFKLYHHHKLGSSYTPNLSASTRIAKFDRRVLEILPKEIPKEISQQDILVNQLNAICNQNFTYNFTSKLIKNESLSTDNILVLTSDLHYANIVNNVIIKITSNKTLTPTFTPTYNVSKMDQTIDFSISSVYNDNNIIIHAEISMNDGSTHNYNMSYHGANRSNY